MKKIAGRGAWQAGGGSREKEKKGGVAEAIRQSLQLRAEGKKNSRHSDRGEQFSVPVQWEEFAMGCAWFCSFGKHSPPYKPVRTGR